MTITNKVSLRSANAGNTPVDDVPDAPTIGTASDSGDGTTASVTFTAPATGGTATTYRVLSTPDSVVGTGGSSPVSVTGLSTGTAYTFQVRGENSTANGPYSSASGSLTLDTPPSFYSIATFTATDNNTNTVNFDLTGLSAKYKHLQFRCLLKDNRNDSQLNDPVNVQFNNNNNPDFNDFNFGGTGSGTKYASAQFGNNTFMSLNSMPTGNSTAGANVYGGMIIDLLDFASTSKYKVIRGLGGWSNNSSSGYQNINISAGSWTNNTGAITSVKFNVGSVSNLWQYSTIALYGIKG